MSMIVRTTENTGVSFPIWLFILASPIIGAFYLIVGVIWLIVWLTSLTTWAWQKWRNR